ncbi:uncharacterized protein LOC133393982 [Anopheles gambiae]|uniref:Uncharacterized protein n=1 Tax=Anopheles coluzzii TaxID=1518534 RepID=A0A6E8WBI5_ANOCL|nr:uncharacterized protein LOC120956446 [Anopheles coluzzii]XP_061517695.1 uncharacterized protein LOC133393982 [Anopheles gambiae]
MKATIALLILGALVLLAAAENNVQHKEKRAANNQASAIVEKIAEKGMVFAGSVVEKLKNSEVARKLLGKVLGAMGTQRGKRSIQTNATVTNYNSAHYQKLVLHQTLATDPSPNRVSSCPIAQNELNWIETIFIAVQLALGEVNKVINGQKVGFTVPKPTPYKVHN